MSTIAIIALVVLAILVILFVGGALGARRHARETAARLHERIAAADRALEQARAADRGWDKVRLEEAARTALEVHRPDFKYDALHLVLVDDRPGTDEDRAQMAAVSDERVVKVVLTRRGEVWEAENVE